MSDRLPLDDHIRHGTTTAYSYGCRCRPCRAASRLAGQRYRDGVQAWVDSGYTVPRPQHPKHYPNRRRR